MDQSRRKLYLMLLGLAAVGLVIDRFVLTESATVPSVASAEMPTPSLVATGITDETASLSMSIPEIPFPLGLQTAENSDPILDLFAHPAVRYRAKMSTGLSYNKDSGRGTAESSSRLTGSLFKSRHSLNGVLVQERLKIAVLDGRPVRIGDSIDGCRLEEVSGYEARFKCEDGLAVLKLKDAGARSRG